MIRRVSEAWTPLPALTIAAMAGALGCAVPKAAHHASDVATLPDNNIDLDPRELELEENARRLTLANGLTVVLLPEASANLVDVKTGLILWEGKAVGYEGSGGSGNIIADLIIAVIVQAIESTGDEAHDLSRKANLVMVFDKNGGLLLGPLSPNADSDLRGR